MNDPTFLGIIQDVNGSTVSVNLGELIPQGMAFVEGHGYRIGQVGSFVRIPMGYADLFGLVSQVGASAMPERLAALPTGGWSWVKVQLIGEAYRGKGFRRGVSQYPTVGDSVHLITRDDLARIYGRADEPRFARIGCVAGSESIPALVDVNRLIVRHSAVVGTTGAGKSTTVAGLLATLSDDEKYPSARIIVLDIHGEYGAALRDRAVVFSVNPRADRGERPLSVPYWAMTFDELLPVTLGSLDDSARGAVAEKIVSLKLAALRANSLDDVAPGNLTVDTPVPFSIHQMWFDLHCEVAATHHSDRGSSQTRDTWALELTAEGTPVQPGSASEVIPPRFRPAKDIKDDPEKIRLSRSSLNIRKQLDGLASMLRDRRFDFLFRPGDWCPAENGAISRDLDSLLDSWLGEQRPICILDLSGIPTSVLRNLVGVLLRIVFDSAFWARHLSEGGRERPILVVLEEAHSYLGPGDTGSAAMAVRRIAREGRKYGMGIMIVSQRPAEIDTTILSQCGTMVAMRLTNASDRGHVTSVVSDNLEGLMSMLPGLRTGEAIIVGDAVHIPTRAAIDPPARNRKPDSDDPMVCAVDRPGGWNRQRERSDYAHAILAWRQQDPRVRRREDPDTVERTPVDSSDIASVGYCASSNVLEVEFHSGGLYEYYEVPLAVYEGLMSATSKGSYFHREIRGFYRYARIG